MTQLKQGLKLVHVFCIAAGAMISSGLFILPGLAHSQAGPAVVFSYLLAGLLASVGVLSVAELATAMPKAGGDYFFISRGMGAGVGTVAGLLSWFSLSLKSAFALVGLTAFAQLIVPVNAYVTAVTLALLFVGLNLVGVKEAARLQVTLVFGLFGLMIFYIIRGVPEVNIQHFDPFVPYGLPAVFSTVGLVFVSYGGVLKIASVAEETENPGRTIPLGMILSLASVSLMYTVMVFVTSGVLSADVLDGSLTPISDGANAIMGRAGRFALSTAAVLAFMTTANAGIMAASRYLLALSRDRQLPSGLGRLSHRTQIPYVSVLATGVLVVLAVFIKLKILVEAASLVFMLSFMLSNASVIVLRESQLQGYRPKFKAPLYPWLQIIGIIGLSFVILEMGEEAFLISAVLILIGFCTYWFYGRKRVQRESALIHLIQRITAKELADGSLETELRDIVHQRDQIVADAFDQLIEGGLVLDLDGPMPRDAFFTQVAEALGPRLSMTPETLKQRFVAREQESSTVLGPHLAIPHIVIEGEKVFDVVVARVRKGIRFSDNAAQVKAVFFLIGTRDERNRHLRALSAIAQIAMEKGFDERWLAAKGTTDIRNMLLLSNRKRHQQDRTLAGPVVTPS
ncbi:MAG: amino acid permease [Phycisphaerae bacterium]|nr:amino acid permease [Phycisphaerae bacterium]